MKTTSMKLWAHRSNKSPWHLIMGENNIIMKKRLFRILDCVQRKYLPVNRLVLLMKTAVMAVISTLRLISGIKNTFRWLSRPGPGLLTVRLSSYVYCLKIIPKACTTFSPSFVRRIWRGRVSMQKGAKSFVRTTLSPSTEVERSDGDMIFW